MSTINFRLYGDQIYGLGSKYFNEYINPDINKEEFLKNFNNGILNLNITGIKKPINILPYISIKDLNVENININIPDEKTNFVLKLSKFKIIVTINEIDDAQIEKLILEKRKKLIEKFIKETISLIEKKEKSSFLMGLLDSLLKRALDGLVIDMNDIEIYLRCNNYLFLLKIDKIIYNEKDGIKINNINLINNIKDSNNKTNIIKNFNIGIDINKNKDNSIDKNSLNINFSNLSFEINSNVYKGTILLYKLPEIDIP